MSFVKKCKRDACGSQAVGANGKPLHGAAKNNFMAKCMRGA
jgi:succinate dehydrogenase/fumarate reductase-like Fe-S protein